MRQLKKEYRPTLPEDESLDSRNFYSTVQDGQQTVTGEGITISGLASAINIVQAVSDPSKVQPERKLGKHEKPEWPANEDEEEED